MPHHPLRLRTVLAAGTAVVALALTGCAAEPERSFSLTPTPTPTATSSRLAAATEQPTAVAIGDSIAIGKGVPYDAAWPEVVAERLGWRLTDLADSASGFTVPGLNTHTYEAQVAAAIELRPQVVLISATRNDVLGSTTVLKNTATAMLQQLRTALPHAEIIAISPLWGADAPPAQLAQINKIVRAAVEGVGGHWIELGQPFLNKANLVQSDRVHPTVAGQNLLATTVIQRMNTLGIAVD